MKTKLRNRKPPRSGYVLLMVLVAIIVVGVTLTRLATTSSRIASDAIAAENTLQQNWAMRSSSKAVLPHVREFFDLRDELLGRVEEARPPAVIADRIAVGKSTLTVVIADEDSKTNLNSLYHNSDTRTIERELQRVLSPGMSRSIALRPAVVSQLSAEKRTARQTVGVSDDEDDEDDEDDDDSEDKEAPRAFRSWGEVFDVGAMRRNYGGDRELAATTKELTLWGNGRLNVARASDAAFVSACRPIVQDGLAKRIVERYRKHPEAGIKIIIEKEVINPRDKQKLLETLGQASSCFSVWVESESALSKKRYFSVIEPDADGILRTLQFAM